MRLFSLALLFFCIYVASDAEPMAGSGSAPIIRLLDVHARIYTDRLPDAGTCLLPACVPRNYELHFQLAMESAISCHYKIQAVALKNEQGAVFSGRFTVSRLLPVHIEGNTQGSLNNHPGGEPPASWEPYLIRRAPFDVFEAVAEPAGDTIAVNAHKVAGALLTFQIPGDCVPGLYSGFVMVSSRDGVNKIPVSFRVYETVLPSVWPLQCVHWLSEAPGDLASGTPPAWWSKRHWALLERAGRQLRSNGDNVMFTPLVNGAHPLITAIKDANGALTFDYSRFDKWVHLFDKLGFEKFAGAHLIRQTDKLLITYAKTGERLPLNDPRIQLDGFGFMEQFLTSLYKYLEREKLTGRWLQHIYDEPASLDVYRRYDTLLKRCMPGIPSIDAINSRPQLFSGMVGIEVFNLPGIIRQRHHVVQQRRQEGKGVWLYNCSSPYPPYPNRHLDLPLTENRLWPWLCYKYGATGYLWWAANLYRGVPDEYSASLGPAPDGTPIHPPGDDWFYYRCKDGLIPSLRIISFREGLIDMALLRMLPPTAEDSIQYIMSSLIHPSIEEGQDRPFSQYRILAETISKGYETSACAFNDARRRMLDMLACNKIN